MKKFFKKSYEILLLSGFIGFCVVGVNACIPYIKESYNVILGLYRLTVNGEIINLFNTIHASGLKDILFFYFGLTFMILFGLILALFISYTLYNIIKNIYEGFVEEEKVKKEALQTPSAYGIINKSREKNKTRFVK